LGISEWHCEEPVDYCTRKSANGKPQRRVGAAQQYALRGRRRGAVGYNFSCCVCTQADLLSGDVAGALGLRRRVAPFVGRIVLAGIIAPVTVAGVDLLRHVRVPSVRRLDVFKALFAFEVRDGNAQALAP
jgi:hypothetical protein